MKDEAAALMAEIDGYMYHPATEVIVPMLRKALRAAHEAGAAEMRERAALLMEGGPNKPGSFTNGAGFCRLVEHAQEMCECAERAAAVRALPLRADAGKP